MIIDIYHDNGIQDYDAFFNAIGDDFVILKATQGLDFTDPELANRISECEARGIPYWAYHFLVPGNPEDQAQRLIDAAPNAVGLCIDTEDDNGERPSREEAKAAIQYLVDRGHKAMLYYMDGEGSDYSGICSEVNSDMCADWVARYGANDGTISKQPVNFADLHQYTSYGTVDGVSGRVDVSVVTNDGKSLKWFKGNNKATIGGIVEMKCTYRIVDAPETENTSSDTIYYFDGYKIHVLHHPDEWEILKQIYRDNNGHEMPHYEWSMSAPWFARLTGAIS